jgi:SAM-dependent methyltransferase
MSTLMIDPSNEAALKGWNSEAAYWVEHEEAYDRSVAAYHRDFLAAAAIGDADRVLDIGCGNGQTTRDAARLATRGDALGVDLSSAMIALARRRAFEQGVHNAHFLLADAQIHPFGADAFDVAISRTGAMFFGDPVAAFTNVARALRPGGRLVLLAWQSLAANEWIRELLSAAAAGRTLPVPPPHAPGPFALSDPERVRAVLGAAGFAGVALAGRRAPLDYGPDVDAAYRFVRGLGPVDSLLRGLDDAARAEAEAELRASVEAHAAPDGVHYASAAWLITAHMP